MSYPPNRILTSPLNDAPFGLSCVSMVGCLLSRISSVLFFIELCVPIAAIIANRFIDIFKNVTKNATKIIILKSTLEVINNFHIIKFTVAYYYSSQLT